MLTNKQIEAIKWSLLPPAEWDMVPEAEANVHRLVLEDMLKNSNNEAFDKLLKAAKRVCEKPCSECDNGPWVPEDGVEDIIAMGIWPGTALANAVRDVENLK